MDKIKEFQFLSPKAKEIIKEYYKQYDGKHSINYYLIREAELRSFIEDYLDVTSITYDYTSKMIDVQYVDRSKEGNKSFGYAVKAIDIREGYLELVFWIAENEARREQEKFLKTLILSKIL